MTEEKYRFLTVLISALGFLGVCASIWIGFIQYAGKIEASYKQPFWENQMKACGKVTMAASRIAMYADEKKIPEKAINDLFLEFYGTGPLYFNNNTVKAVGEIGSRAVRCNAGTLKKNECVRPIFNGLSMNVAKSCRDMLASSWDVPLEALNSDYLEPDIF